MFEGDCSRSDAQAIPTQLFVMPKSAWKLAFRSTPILGICSLSRVAHYCSSGESRGDVIAKSRCVKITRNAIPHFLVCRKQESMPQFSQRSNHSVLSFIIPRRSLYVRKLLFLTCLLQLRRSLYLIMPAVVAPF